jgi:hypothetical protein
MRKLLLFCGMALVVSTAQAASISYTALLSGANENPPNVSPGTGNALVIYDSTLHTLLVDVVFQDLSALDTASHIHCCTASPETGTAGVATTLPTFTGFPTGVTNGSYLNTFDLTLASSWNPAFVNAHGGTTAGAEAALANGLAAGSAYLNIHSTAFPAGEIRGFLEPVPEPSTLSLLAIPLFGLIAILRKWRAEGSV